MPDRMKPLIFTHAGGGSQLNAQSYAQWLRGLIAKGREDSRPLIPLLESSVSEPEELLRELVVEAFLPKGDTSRYVSAFAGGNPFVIDHLARVSGVEAESVLCTTGATGALSLLYRSLLRAGERILIETPCFDLFHGIAQLHGFGVDHFRRRAPDYAIDLAEVAAALTPQTRLIILSNLHNPSGMALDLGILRTLGAMAEERGIKIIVDEVYRDYVPARERPPVAASLSPAFISINSLTKSYGLSSLRCGWIIADPVVLAPVRAFADEVEFGISKLSHAVAALVLENADRFDAYRNNIMGNARPIIQSYHAQWVSAGYVEGVLPCFSCTTFPRLVGIPDAVAFCDWLADNCGVLVAPGEYFGAPGHIRIGFAQMPEVLASGLQALTDGLQSYRGC